MGPDSPLLIIAGVVLGTISLVGMFLRQPQPDPRLAAEPLSVTVRKAAQGLGLAILATAIGAAVPREVGLPALVLFTATVIVATAWRWRRRPPGSHAPLPMGTPPAPQTVQAVAASTGEWVRAVAFAAVLGVLVIVAVGLAARIANSA